ncbi:MAG: glycosyltransferase family 2 protein [Lachnospiraceae bacterium]|nr:glycosyltransferase family 2 protein [Lachnospiraceae bacterium]
MDKYAILLATYNGEKYIVDLLDSMDRQTRKDFKCYIHDDGSTDKTMDLVKEWIKDKDNYEIMEFESVKGAKYNFLEMLKRVEAEYYMFSDQDDVWLENKVEKLINEIERVTKNRTDTPTVVHSDMYVTDEKLNIISDSFIRYIGRDIYRNSLPQLLIDNPAAGTTMIINKELRDRAIEINNIDEIPMHDQWIMCVAAATGVVHVIDEPLIYYRQHTSNVMGAESESKKEKVLRNAKDVVTGEFARKKRKFHQKEVKIARQLMYVHGIDLGTKRFLIRLIRLNNCNKIQRMEFYRKNGLDRKEHSCWMRLWV